MVRSTRLTGAPLLSMSPPRSRFVKRDVVALAEDGLADGGEDVIVVVVADVDRQVAPDPFDGARLDQRTRAAGADAVIDGFERQVLEQMPDAIARHLRLGGPATLPKRGHVAQPQVRGVKADRHLSD